MLPRKNYSSFTGWKLFTFLYVRISVLVYKNPQREEYCVYRITEQNSSKSGSKLFTLAQSKYFISKNFLIRFLSRFTVCKQVS